jgi:hypothetical protein
MINFPDAPAEGQVYSAGTASWLYTGGKWTAAPAAPGKYVVGCFVPGTLTASQALLVHRVSKAVTLPANFAAYAGYASQAGGTAAATASTVITVARALAASPTGFSDRPSPPAPGPRSPSRRATCCASPRRQVRTRRSPGSPRRS